MKLTSVQIRIFEIEQSRRLPGSWNLAAFRHLLEVLEFEGAESLSDSEVEDMALMALQDLEAEEAMSLVITNFTDNLFTKGQIQNLCEEMKETAAWEEYSEIDHQRALYVCVDLLHDAFPRVYPEPSACRLNISLSGKGVSKAHASHPLTAVTLVRALGLCQADTCILNRLFPEQIQGAPFPEADSIIWDLKIEESQPDTLSIHLHGSAYWFRGLEEDVQVICDLDWSNA
ncbi:MAG: hypothetical protein PF795_00885 [Kiritimatiellae bacterium]|jgi:hypothetical protein|nr:hypothetical protein [Kiritimatiellia bacterium]